MGKTRRPYSAEYREKLIQLYRSGRTAEELGSEYEPSAQSIRNWVLQADRDEGIRTDGPKSDELKELRDLRRQVKQLRVEREILKKAAAWFAREIDLPKSDSDS